jgi:hypothetical protein
LFWRHQERNTIGLGFSYGLKKKKGKTTLYDERLIQIIQLFILSCPGFTFFVFLI